MSASMYGDKNSVDERAVKATLSYNPLASGRYEAESLGGLAEDDFEYALQRGLLFRPNQVTLDHDEAVERLLSAVETTDRSKQVDLFLASLATHRLDYRIGLGTFAAARNFPRHPFSPRPDAPSCAICGMSAFGNALDRNACSRQRFAAGTPIKTNSPALAFYLECQLKLGAVSPTPADLKIFESFLRILLATPHDEPAKRSVLKQLRKVANFKSSPEEAKGVLETLGYCGILETKEHGGMLHRYVNLGLAPRKTHSSDWRYPVDFWTGKDGLNKESLKAWFGSYPELAEFM